ncbi:hypothetical protein DSO57_1039461 [Entomophthora muscae]|uniref:Uncharacterized protein n=2 Tax=Entomophthora muscae TaxID=34485 RepID=A0ACC2RGV0_9FUNG|nr:hypothetical protein DSO57_1025901 [Entomophthora muscae]KAJ9063571.1 hypothetical protein DSO57_1039461 [Entomophthora muscae]
MYMHSFHLLSLLLPSFSIATSYDRVIAFGDSISDNGNVFQMSAGFMPDPSEYKEGRFSDGPTWVEYLAQGLHANLTDLAYGGATTNTDMYPDSVGAMVPGCIQQAESFNKTFARSKASLNSTLLTVVFQGNDFFSPSATAQSYMDNMDRCLRLMLKMGFHDVLIGVSNAPELTPGFKLSPPELKSSFGKNTALVQEMWKGELQSLKKDFSNINLYTMDFRSKANLNPTNQ